MDCIVRGVAKSWTRLSDFHFLGFGTDGVQRINVMGGGRREAGALLGQSASRTRAPPRTPAFLGQSRRKSTARKGGPSQGAKGKESSETESPLPTHSPVAQGWRGGVAQSQGRAQGRPPWVYNKREPGPLLQR